MDHDSPVLSHEAIERYDATQPSAISVKSLDDIRRISMIFVESGMFKADRNLDAKTKMYQAGVKIIAGVEFGIQPFAAMRGINIINGNAEMSANLMAAKVKSHPKYEYRVAKWDQDECVIEFYELPYAGAKRDEWDKLGESSFSKDDAVRARLNGDNWQKFARNMYFARAMSNGVRIYCPDIFYGAPVYVEGEIAGEFAESTNTEQAVIEEQDTGTVTAEEASTPDPIEAELVVDDTERPSEQEQPLARIEYITEAQRRRLMALLKDAGVTTKPERNELVSNIIMRDIESTNELTKDEASRVIEELMKGGDQ